MLPRQNVHHSESVSSIKTILIVAGQSLFREGLRAIINKDANCEVVGMARTAEEAFQDAVRLHPNLVLLDLSPPDCGGVDLIRRLHKRLPKTRIIAVGPDARPERVSATIESGAMGFIQRDSQSDRLIQCISMVTAGGFCVDDRTLLDIVRENGNGETGGSHSSGSGEGVSKRETQIIKGMAEGRTLKSIAADLQVSLKTVENHRARIVNKLGLRTAVDLVRYAAHVGLIDLDEWKQDL
jgi:DNA-binding NarL/FixJ family response regulator